MTPWLYVLGVRRVVPVVLLVVIASACGGDGPAAPSVTSSSVTSSSTTTTSVASTTTTSVTTTTSMVVTTSTPATTAPTRPSHPVSGFPIDGGRAVVTMTVDDEPREVLVVVPEGVETPVSLVLVFHGFTGTSTQVEEQSGFSELAVEKGFVVAYPQGAGVVPSWRTSSLQGDADVLFAEAVIELVGGAVPVDRVLVSGMSNGGGMAGRLACDRAELVDAAAPVAAAHPPTVCAPSEAVPILAFHAVDDRVVRYDGFGPIVFGQEEWAASWARRNGCAATPEVAVVAEGVDTLTWDTCDAPVILYRSETGGHRWPGPDAPEGSVAAGFEASRVMWDWFERLG